MHQIREQVVHDELEDCPYLPGQRARLPLRWQLHPLSPEELDQRLEEGDRRVGRMLYRPSCPSCSACEPLRIPVADFARSRSQERAWKRNQDLRVEVGPARFSQEKLALYNLHKHGRGLARSESRMTRQGYEGWFLSSCAQTTELRYFVGERLLGVSILDVGRLDVSSVYFYFDPAESRRSLGVYSSLFEIEQMRLWGLRHYYLGLYVQDCSHLSYKASYFPHERLVGGLWTRFEG
jgi:arginine-tRNA-protein transferase